ncbi:MAG TPA: 8-oxo-dGTP diphosphatase MutT [Calditrichaeota bacterium]|nr:8-oxo-dGTP diphosphatase MutT [Calditrichota bacterium]
MKGVTKPPVPVVAAILFNEKRQILITQRLQNSHLGGLWEFPGGRVENGETAELALRRELKEELDLDIRTGKLFWQATFEYDIKTVDISFYFCSLQEKDPFIKPIGVQAYRWIEIEELTQFDFPPADREAIQRLRKDLAGLENLQG